MKTLSAVTLVKEQARDVIGMPPPTKVLQHRRKGGKGSRTGLSRAGVNGGFDPYAPPVEEENIFGPTVALNPIQRGTTAHVPVITKQRQTRHEVAPVLRFTPPVIAHANFLLRSQGKNAYENYLEGIKKMSIPSTGSIAEEVHRHREVKEEAAESPLEAALRDAEEKAKTYRTEADRMGQEADKWEEAAESLRKIVSATFDSSTPARSGRGGGIGGLGTDYLGKVKEVMADGRHRKVGEIRAGMLELFPKNERAAMKGRIYPAVANVIKRSAKNGHGALPAPDFATSEEYMWVDAPAVVEESGS